MRIVRTTSEAISSFAILTVLSFRPNLLAIVLRLGQKKSLATIPTPEKRKSIQPMMIARARDLKIETSLEIG